MTRIQVSDTLETWETVAVSRDGNDFFTKNGFSVTHDTIDAQTQKISLKLLASDGAEKFARVLVSMQQ